MRDRPLYLRGDIAVKPLVNQWVATEQNVPPVQAALNCKNVQAALLASFLEAPEMHRKAAQTPALMGGPWVELPAERAPDVRALLAALERDQAGALEFAHAVEKLDLLLRAVTPGESLADLYARVPPPLRGYVELVYDIAHQPSMRFIEPLLYRSRHYRADLQSVALAPIGMDARPYQYTTPWLPDAEHVHLALPFADLRLDRLFAAKRAAARVDEMAELCGVAAAERERFGQMFSPGAPPRAARYDGEGVRIRYFGHACLLIESREVAILTDPIVSYRYPGEVPRFTFEDLPERLDYVVLTHYHKDHVYFETLLQLRHMTDQVIVPKNLGGPIQDPGFKLMLEQIGFARVRELDWMERMELPGGALTALPFLGEHCDLDIRSKAAHLIELEGQRVLCAADSDNREPELYARLREVVGAVDTLFLGMECVGAPMSSVYGGLMVRPLARNLDQKRRTTGSAYPGAIDMVEKLGVQQVYVYAMGAEPWLRHILPIVPSRDDRGLQEAEKLISECRRRGLVAGMPYCQQEIALLGRR